MAAVHAGHTKMEISSRCVAILERWAGHANQSWTWLSSADATRFGHRRKSEPPTQASSADPVAGYYGTGYASWGVMAQAATLGVFAVLANVTGNRVYLERCLKGLRYLFGTHTAGPLHLTDGAKWGAGISTHDAQYSALWVEQGMFAFDLVDAHVADYDRALIKGVITTEADRYLAQRIEGGLGPEAGRAETNAWKAAVLARAAAQFPEQPRAAQWRQKSCAYWLNAISVEQDAHDTSIVRGLCVRDWHQIANFHAHFGVTHRSFFHPSDIALTLGVMVLAALMHTKRGNQIPAETFHHWPDALAVLTQLLWWDNTVAAVGGQTWPRYTWDQTMILPVLAWAGTHPEGQPAGAAPVLPPDAALEKVAGILTHLAAEQEENGDGSFYSQRLSGLREEVAWDYLRYEAGTAFALAAAYTVMAQAERQKVNQQAWHQPLPPRGEASYREPSLGTIWHRSEQRFASWCWQACRVPAQGLVLPRAGVRMCEWNGNLVGTARLREHEQYHALQYHREHEFSGGFATLGLLAEQLPMWHMADKTPSLRHGIAFWALPDGCTCILLDLVWCERMVHVVQHKGVLYKLANDITNQNRRSFSFAHGHREISGVGAQKEIWRPDSAWLVVDDCLYISPLWGGELAVEVQGQRAPARYGYGEATLLWDEICAPLQLHPARLSAGETLRDMCAAYVCGVSGAEGPAVAAAMGHTLLPVKTASGSDPHARAAIVSDRVGNEYLIAVNFDRAEVAVALPAGWRPFVLAGHAAVRHGRFTLPPASLALCTRGS